MACDIIRAAYASDDGYARFLGISMLSLFENNKSAPGIEVFVLDSGIGAVNREKLESVAAGYGRKLTFIDVNEHISRLQLRMGARKISVVSYARLFLSSILPETYDRVLYLDCDTVICGDISGMYATPFNGALVAGVQDTVDAFFTRAIGMPEKCRYVNAGILLINLAAWRKEGMEKKFMDFIARFEGNVPHHDQGVINGVCGVRRVILPLRFNATSNIFSFTAPMIRRMYDLDGYYSQDELLAARQDPAILHFTSGLTGRPWEENCAHPQREKFARAAAMSPWSDAPLMPDGMKSAVKMTALARRLLPDSAFAAIYRSLCWITHQRK